MTKAILKILSLILAFILLVPLMIACGEENPENEQTELQRFEKLSEYEKAFFILTNDINVKKIEGMLYNVSIGQEIILSYEGKIRHTRVVNVKDTVWDNLIYREIEIVIIDRDV